MGIGIKIAILIFIITSCQSFISAEKCTRPVVKRRQVFIYRTMGKINVKVYRCLYNNTISPYSDISDQCISAFKTGQFLDKWDKTNNLADTNSPIVLEQYVTTADPLRNIIYLRSGTLCRFDRGFCYDPTETISYAAVWNVVPVPSEKCPTKLEQVFYGYVDIWSFSPENQNYLFFYDINTDRSFSLKLANDSLCHGKPVSYTNERGYIVSKHSLTQNFQPIKKLNRDYFPLNSKRVVSEAILKDCDLSAYYSLDFEEEISHDYLSDPKNLKIMFNLHQKQIHENQNYAEQFAKNLTKIRAFLESRNKDVNNFRVMLGLYKTQIDAFNSSLKTLYKNMNAIGYQQNDYDKLILNNKDLSERISKLSDTMSRLEKSTKLISSNNQINKEDLERAVANLKNEFNKNYTTLNKSIFNSLQIDINDIRKLISQNEDTILQKLEQKLITVNNSSTVCNKKIDNLNNNFDKSLGELKKKLSQDAVLLEKSIIKYVDIADNNILKKIDSTNSKLQDLEGKNKASNNEDVLKIMTGKLESLNKTTSVNIGKIKNDLIIIDKTCNSNYDTLDQTVHGNKKLFESEIILLKDIIAKGNKNLKNEITDIYLMNGKDIKKELININDSLSNRIFSSDLKIQDLNQQIKNIKRDVEIDKKSVNLQLQDTIKDVLENSQKLNLIPIKIEKEVMNKLIPTLDSLENKSKTCYEEIDNLKRDAGKSLDGLKHELIQLFQLRDEIMKKKLHEVKDNISNKIILDDTKVQEFENKLNQCRDFAENNKLLTEKGLQEIRRNISGIFDFVNQISSGIDKNILNKYNSILSTLEEKSRACMQDIKNLKNHFDIENNDLKQKLFEGFTAADESIITKLDKVNNSLLNKINSSDSKIDKMESKIDEFSENVKNLANKYELRALEDSLDETNKFLNILPSKIEDDIFKKINPSLNSLQSNNDKCEIEIRDLKDNVKNSVHDIRNEVFNKFSSTSKNIQEVNDSIIQTIDKYDHRITYLESKTKGFIQAAKAKTESDAKIEFLIKQADSTYKTLADNIDKVDSLKIILNKMEGAINNLNSDNKSKEIYLRNLNQTVERNKDILNRLEADMTSIKNSGDIEDIAKQIKKHALLIKENSDDINILKKNQQGSDKIIDGLKINEESAHQQVMQLEQEIQILKHNLSLSNKLISDGDKIMIDLRSQIDDLKDAGLKKEKEFTNTLSNFQNILSRDAGEDLKKELADLKKCCADHDLKLLEKEKEIKEMKDEFRKAIKELKTEQDKLKNIVYNPQEVDAL